MMTIQVRGKSFSGFNLGWFIALLWSFMSAAKRLRFYVFNTCVCVPKCIIKAVDVSKIELNFEQKGSTEMNKEIEWMANTWCIVPSASPFMWTNYSTLQRYNKIDQQRNEHMQKLKLLDTSSLNVSVVLPYPIPSTGAMSKGSESFILWNLLLGGPQPKLHF